MFDESKKLDERLGTPYYVAPEVLEKSYTQKCDLWSIGVITFSLLSGTPPFNGETDQEIMKKVKIGKYSFGDPVWKKISGQAKHFVMSLLLKDQDKRPSAEEALKHAWIKQADEDIMRRVNPDAAVSALNNLTNFQASSKLKQATYAFICGQLLTKTEKEQIDKVFRAMDKNGDGVLTKEEIKKGYLEYFGREMSDEKIDQMFSSVDVDGNGSIDYSEFIVASLNERSLLSNKKLKAAFKMFDKDGGGTISISEIKQALSFGKNINEKMIYTIMKQVDDNGDCEISYNEFASMMLNTLK